MKRLLGALLMLAVVLIQVACAPRLEIAGAFPNLVLLAVIAMTWTSGVRAALVWACAGGLLLDLTSPGPLGPHAMALLASVYVSGFWARNLDRDNPLHPAAAAAVSTAIYSLILVESDDLLGLPVPPPALAVQLATAACVYNALLMPLALIAIRRLRGSARPRTA